MLDYLIDAALHKQKSSTVERFMEDPAVERAWSRAYEYAGECRKAFSAVGKAYERDVKASKMDSVAFGHARQHSKEHNLQRYGVSPLPFRRVSELTCVDGSWYSRPEA